MNNTINKFKVISMSLLMGMSITTPVLSEDIEIYVGSNPTAAASASNILFILDTSGSMDAELDVEVPISGEYDSTQTYSGSYDSSRVYYSDTHTIADIDGYVSGSRNKCNAATLDFAVYGFFRSQVAQFYNKDWSTISRTSANIECVNDSGIHGSSSSSNPYAQEGRSSGWTSNSTREIDWNTNGADYTLYSGNYLNWSEIIAAGGITTVQVTRLEVMKMAMRDMVNSSQGVNIALMRFDRGISYDDASADGGMVIKEMEPVETSRTDFITELNTLTHEGYTPLSEVLYEGGLYFQGAPVDYGNNSYAAGGVVQNSISEARDASDTSKYKSPIEYPCQKNHIVLLTDGNENAIGNFDATRKAKFDTSSDCRRGGGSGSTAYCLAQIADYMATVDQAPDIPQVQTITTHTIGLNIDHPFLQATATAGKGGYYPATDYADLTAAFKEIVSLANETSSTFASPAVSVNAFNRTTNRDDLYFTLFKPSSQPHWDGNFKRFKLIFDTDGVPIIVDVNNNPAVDTGGTGFFVEDSRSYWSDVVDGAETELGGAASKLFAASTLLASRNIYSNLTLTSALTVAGNRVEENNSNLTDAIMGVSGTAKTNLIQWARGIDVDDVDKDGSATDARRQMGEPLHSQPALVEYGDGNTGEPNIVAYVATNDGYLHAFDTRSPAGTEKFAFIPKELLPNLKTLYANSASSPKQYGLDGNVAAYVKDVDRDGEIESGDRVIVYVGMRRGGQNYYALDVTNPDAPQYLWTIYGGQNNTVNSGRGDFTELGQTWSTPQVKKIRLNGADVPVLIFAGGYDVDQDNTTTRVIDDVGRGIFIVNAITGNLLWRMGPDAPANLTDTNMKYSIPSDIAAADAAGDGYVDHLYVGDIGGQMWRVDINNDLGETESNINTIISGGRIADLADDSAASNRRFFYAPDVAILKDVNDVSYISVLITSGNRAHPLQKTVQDRAFMIRDLPILKRPTTYTTVTVNDSVEELYDTTSNTIGQGSTAERVTALQDLQSSNGWFFDFDLSLGEKGLTKPLIFLGEAFFATYVPQLPDPDQCVLPGGSGFLYHIALGNAKPVKNYDTVVDDPDNLTAPDRKVKLARSGIPADPTLILPSGGAAICVGTECNKAEGIDGHKRVYWFEE